MTTPSLTGSNSSGTFTSSTSWSLSHTVSSTGTNRAIFALITAESTDTNPTGVVFNSSETMTQVLDLDGLGVEGSTVWYLANPTVTTANIVASWASNKVGHIHAFTLQDCPQTSPIDTSDRNGAGSGTSVSKSITTGTNNTLVVSYLAANNSATSPSLGGGQTQIASTTDGGGFIFVSSYTEKTTAGSESHSYSWSGSAPNDEGIFSIKPITSLGGGLLGLGQL